MEFNNLNQARTENVLNKLSTYYHLQSFLSKAKLYSCIDSGTMQRLFRERWTDWDRLNLNSHPTSIFEQQRDTRDDPTSHGGNGLKLCNHRCLHFYCLNHLVVEFVLFPFQSFINCSINRLSRLKYRTVLIKDEPWIHISVHLSMQ